MRIQHLFALRKQTHLTSQNDRGSIALIAALAFLPLSLSLAVVADGGRVWSHKTSIQNEVEAKALAVAQKWATNRTACSNSDLTLTPTSSGEQITCDVSPRTNGVVATVSASSSVDLYFAQLFGRETSRIASTASVRVGPTSSGVNVLPFAIYKDNSSLLNWLKTGMTSTQIYKINIQSEDEDCSERAPGNWALLDLNGGSNSARETQAWIESGYPGVINSGQLVSGDPGIPSSGLKFDSLVGKSAVLPVFSTLNLNGDNALYEIAGFVKVKITAIRFQSESEYRHIKVVFQKESIPGDPGSNSAKNYGLTSWSVCSFDGNGDCS
jgi:Flp pilus assembly protein TadG